MFLLKNLDFIRFNIIHIDNVSFVVVKMCQKLWFHVFLGWTFF